MLSEKPFKMLSCNKEADVGWKRGYVSLIAVQHSQQGSGSARVCMYVCMYIGLWGGLKG